jgi:hypothetical protein
MDYISKADWRNPEWKYVKAADTNIAKTFARIRKEMEQQKQLKPQTVVAINKTGVK